ncbi:MAG: SDR family oxidoreductase [Heliobacteriaceae bacterium]|jgi:NAD(P)-dependent dehydrogenase (short-subunit alcohol dehydrogenase family)|nr:SDR family oxidoreductase [Heliobacteriaceae bacterium]
MTELNILVTGASRGIGKAAAQELSGRVYVTGRDENALKLCDSAGYCVCDLAENIDVLAGFIEDKNIDVLVNNAAEYIYGAIEEASKEDIQRLYAANLMAPAYLISKAVPHMKSKKWGRIVNIGSISGVMGEAYAGLYSSSKAGLIGLTKALALELAQYNITVNTVNPGWVDTDMGRNSAGEFSTEEIIETIPQRRFVEPVEVAKLVKYLVSEDARGITGQSINICAGLSLGI